jgi:hypothetical protein
MVEDWDAKAQVRRSLGDLVILLALIVIFILLIYTGLRSCGIYHPDGGGTGI